MENICTIKGLKGHPMRERHDDYWNIQGIMIKTENLGENLFFAADIIIKFLISTEVSRTENKRREKNEYMYRILHFAGGKYLAGNNTRIPQKYNI